MARVCLISRDNGWGLTKDIQLLSSILTTAGIQVGYKQWDTPRSEKYDLNVHLELVGSRHFRSARKNILIPNPEWFMAEWVNFKGRFNSVLVKTHHAKHIFEHLGFKKVQYVGFSTQDIWQDIPRKHEFLHMAGNSRLKGTLAVINTWNTNPQLPKLWVFNTFQDLSPHIKGKNIEYHFGRVNDLTRLQNQCLYHIQPSESEGYGHVLYESLAVGSVLITTDAPPMNEAESSIKVSAKRAGNYNQAWLYKVEGLAEIVKQTLKMDNDEVKNLVHAARQEYLTKDLAFKNKIVEVIKDELTGK